MSTAIRAAWRSLVIRELASRYAQARDGATAVEFALVALPFFALVGACLENGIVFWEQEILQQAVSDASRQIYTGAFQTTNAGTTDTATLMSRFRTAISQSSTTAIPALSYPRYSSLRRPLTRRSPA